MMVAKSGIVPFVSKQALQKPLLSLGLLPISLKLPLHLRAEGRSRPPYGRLLAPPFGLLGPFLGLASIMAHL